MFSVWVEAANKSNQVEVFAVLGIIGSAGLCKSISISSYSEDTFKLRWKQVKVNNAF